MNVYGMKMKRKEDDWKMVSTGRRIRELWKEKGKDDEGRREWERRWKEAGDIMNEEDLMETSIMYLCFPDYDKQEKDGLIVPSECSYDALSVLLNRVSDRDAPYHFAVYDINNEPSNVVFIRNIPYNLFFRFEDEAELRSMIQKVCTVSSIDPILYEVMRVTLNSSDDAMKVAYYIDGQMFHNRYLSVSGKMERPYRKQFEDKDTTSVNNEDMPFDLVRGRRSPLCSQNSLLRTYQGHNKQSILYNV